MGEAMGTIGELWRHPVKSMLGERVGESEVTERGLAGDRRFALMDRETGKVASAKCPRLWRELVRCRAVATDSGGARITVPDGTTWSTGDLDVHDGLSAHLGRKVTLIDAPPPEATLERSRPEEVEAHGVDAEVAADLVRFGSAAPSGSFFDFAPLHLVTTSALRALARLSPRGTVETERYRPNLVIETDGDGFPEHAWVGCELWIGDEVAVEVLASTPRCAVPTLAHGDLPRDPEALRVPARHNRVPALPGRAPEPCVGVYARVLRGGRVRVGDGVRM